MKTVVVIGLLGAVSCAERDLTEIGRPLVPDADTPVATQFTPPAGGGAVLDAGVDAALDGPPDANTDTTNDAGVSDSGPPITLPQDWCERAGVTEQAFVRAALDIADEYFYVQFEDCKTALLTTSLGEPESRSWFNYLTKYTLAMANCPLVYGEIPDGIRAFGPGNTGVIGVEPPPMGRDDVDLLIAHYVTAFGDRLELTLEERDAVSAHLLGTAQTFISPEIQSGLSLCARGDAGL